jgi:hypothetical protein
MIAYLRPVDLCGLKKELQRGSFSLKQNEGDANELQPFNIKFARFADLRGRIARARLRRSSFTNRLRLLSLVLITNLVLSKNTKEHY